jgi:hypothetical protein
VLLITINNVTLAAELFHCVYVLSITIDNVTLAAEIFLPLLFSTSTWIGIPSPGTKPIVSKYSVAQIGPDLQHRQQSIISLLAPADC